MKVFYLLLCVFFLTGCNKEEFIVCKINLENTKDNYRLNSEYKIYYEDSLVTRIEKEDIYMSIDSNILNYFYEAKNLEYEKLNNSYGGYEFELIK